MSRKVTLFLVILVVLIFAGGLLTARLGQSLVHLPGQSKLGAPAQVDALAQSRLAFTPPPGYVANYGVDTSAFVLAGYAPEAKGSHLILMQMPDWSAMTDEAIIAQALAQLEQEYGVTRTDATVVEQRTTMTAGNTAQAYTVIEGTDQSGAPYRAFYAIVPNLYGLAVLYFEEPAARWQDATAEALVASIRLPD